ncbi:hypothetical protein [Paucilactobacillus kaifaensis]|uniref:hypothetical protein n=1 Tax=Paucilactobacillus kaifaensis TaxID=2559921 RepID=UPI0010F52D6B|nr:hypothetical protein [Paucilactobacillus kaifaensis]
MQRQKAKSDEWYTPVAAVEAIVPYIKQFKTIWCPFDKPDSNYVKVLKKNGFTVINTHIEMGGDFLAVEIPECDAIVSNPPYSIKDNILERLFKIDKPFAMLMNVAGLYDSKRRFELLERHPVSHLYIYPRIKFFNDDKKSSVSSPTYQSAYVCYRILENRIELKKLEADK